MNPTLASSIAEEMSRQQEVGGFMRLEQEELDALRKTSDRFMNVPLESTRDGEFEVVSLPCLDREKLCTMLGVSEYQRPVFEGIELALRIVQDSGEAERTCYLVAGTSPKDKFVLQNFLVGPDTEAGSIFVRTGHGEIPVRVGSPELQDIEAIADCFIP